MLLALRELQHAQHLLAKHQRQQADGLDLVIPHLKQHLFVRREIVALVQIHQQHFARAEHARRERAFLLHFALIVQRRGFIDIVRGVNRQFAFARRRQNDTDGIDTEIAVDLVRDLGHQLVEMQFGEYRVSDGDQNAKVIALAAQQRVILAVAKPRLDLLRRDAHDLRQRLQPGKLFFAKAFGRVANKLAAAENMPFGGERGQAVVAKGRVERECRKLRPGLGEFIILAVQHFGAREQPTHRAVREHRFVFIRHGIADAVDAVKTGTLMFRVIQQNVNPIRHAGGVKQRFQRLRQRAEIGLAHQSASDVEQPLLAEIAHGCV